MLADQFGWDVEEARKIWNFGPEGVPIMRNILLEATRGVQYLHESKDHINGGFQSVCRNGVLCGEESTGCCFKLKDATLHADALHRGAGQLTPAARSAMYGCMLLSKPYLLEPLYLVEILAPDGC
jgi:elongation factor 2